MTRLIFTNGTLLVANASADTITSIKATTQGPRPATYTTVKHRGRPAERVLKESPHMTVTVHAAEPVEALDGEDGQSVEVVWGGKSWTAELQYRFGHRHQVRLQW